jgi:hypothetical protein
VRRPFACHDPLQPADRLRPLFIHPAHLWIPKNQGKAVLRSLPPPCLATLVMEHATVDRSCLQGRDTSNKPFEWTGRHQLPASPPQSPCLPLRGSVRQHSNAEQETAWKSSAYTQNLTRSSTLMCRRNWPATSTTRLQPWRRTRISSMCRPW